MVRTFLTLLRSDPDLTLVLPDGIAASDDPLLSLRSGVYTRSFTRRAGEPKRPSEVNVSQVLNEQ